MNWTERLRRAWPGSAPRDDSRWVVVDTESSGLDPRHDRLLAIAGTAVRWQPGASAATLRLMPADSFDVVLRHDGDVVPADRPNILLHGLGLGAQRGGVTPEAALQAFERWVGDSPLIAFHAAFDEALVARAMSAALGRRLRGPWLDLEHVAEVVSPDVPARTLDDWLAHLRIPCARRHQAAADAFATAEMLLALWPRAMAQGRVSDFRALRRFAAQRRWLERPA